MKSCHFSIVHQKSLHIIQQMKLNLLVHITYTINPCEDKVGDVYCRQCNFGDVFCNNCYKLIHAREEFYGHESYPVC